MNRIYEYQRRFLSVCLTCLLCLAVYACGQKQDPLEKIRDLEYTVIAEDNIPQELLAKIEERKEDTFKLTFEDQGFLYICVGYGTQQTGGYSIAVNDLYETANAIYIDTNLIGPSPEEKSKQVASYPYVVVKMEFLEKPVVFE
ncbi:MAG: protease complex subunit PrcB family protein [Lachnospiraceae bacterium]|nr:protease complex subunit PrcB family protein [Lachnospiraceae bacterium]